MNKYVFGLLGCFILFSCNTISVNNESQILTKNQVTIGTIGIVNGNAFSSAYEQVAIPVFKQKLSLKVQPIAFSKNSFKAFEKSNHLQNKVKLAFVDSLKVKPTYISLQFSDRVAITSELNNLKNTGVRSYLETKQDAQMVTSVSIAFSSKQLNSLKNADEVFLIQSSSKKFSLEFKTKDGKTEIISFSDGIVFGYQLSGFCWKQNNKHQLVIADMIPNAEGCPPNTYKKAHKAVQKENYFKL